MTMTLQYGPDGKERSWGYYSTYKSSEEYLQKEINLTYSKMTEIYDRVWSDITGY